MSKKNYFCNISDLSNEADVEQIFARRLIEFLGYIDSQIKPKKSLTELVVGGLHKKESLYRPDFAVKVGNDVAWIYEAKSPKEDLHDHIWQPRGYCQLINGQYSKNNPVKYYVLSNGTKTFLYQWDINVPLLQLDFSDFIIGNNKFTEFIEYLSSTKFQVKKKIEDDQNLHVLEKGSIENINLAFSWCHQHIYKKDNISQAAAFTEFVKVIFLKLLSDQDVKEKYYPSFLAVNTISIPSEDVKFSSKWVEEQQKHTPNPLDTIQFQNLIAKMEVEVQLGKKKRIFSSNERINLSPETILGVVKKIQNIFLFGIDIDLNGRLFETFLNATMRGKDLGQFFTPRSIVKLGVKLARLRVNAPLENGGFHTDVVLDPCCGTGGFLIDSLSEMWMKVNNNSSLSDKDKKKLSKKIAEGRAVRTDAFPMGLEEKDIYTKIIRTFISGF